MVLTEKVQISALSSGNIDKFEYLTSKNVLASNQI